jgi:hypothetical protein
MADKKTADSSTDRPLGLTVHSLPEPAAVARADGQRTRSGRWLMLAVLLVCAAPIVASYFTYYVIRPQNAKSYGELIQPSRSLPAVQGVRPDGSTVELTALKKQWLLISVGSGRCPDDCQERLYLQRQILTGLGRERDRVEWVWLIQDDAPVNPAIQPGLAEATVLRVGQTELAQWLQAQPGHSLEEHFYLVDPMGEWMMRFPAPIDRAHAPRIKRDLERLLRAAAGWDQPGR